MLSNRYIKSGESSIVSYAYEDMVRQTGVIRFYACASENAGVNVYYLTTNPNTTAYPPVVMTSATNQDYDYTFNVPMVLEGDVIFNYSIECNGTGSCGVTVELMHVDAAGTATSLGTTNGSGLSGAAGSKRECHRLTVSNTVFKIGDKLRLRIDFVSAGAGTKWLWTNPANDSACLQSWNPTGFGPTYYPDTFFSVDVPFKIDL